MEVEGAGPLKEGEVEVEVEVEIEDIEALLRPEPVYPGMLPAITAATEGTAFTAVRQASMKV